MQLAKGIATCGVWFALVAIISMMGEMAFFGYVFVMILGLMATGIIWGSGEGSSAPQHEEKAKRQSGDKLALLMELLEEDERAAFTAALQARLLDAAGPPSDGELPLSMRAPSAAESLADMVTTLQAANEAASQRQAARSSEK